MNYPVVRNSTRRGIPKEAFFNPRQVRPPTSISKLREEQKRLIAGDMGVARRIREGSKG